MNSLKRLLGFMLIVIPYLMAVLFLIEIGWIVNWLGIIGAITLFFLLTVSAAKLLTKN